MWLSGRLVPDHKTIADFRKDNGTAIRKVCARFIALCRMTGLLTQPSVAIDGSKFKAVNNRDKNFTRAKMERRMAQIEESVARYLQQLDTADRQEPSEALTTKTNRLNRQRPPIWMARVVSEVGAVKVDQTIQGLFRGRTDKPERRIWSHASVIQQPAHLVLRVAALRALQLCLILPLRDPLSLFSFLVCRICRRRVFVPAAA